ncbi:AzlC family ABC transporter permease [Kiloniella laminariae]|uniref:AzlC family ABC transporter permease n=1 Tax=Kiloniella laminariae TaxID=454162 RepID=A0ABT4LMM5_9PROT|nr:AzlC family ABC transporter permease [Kiloniella laminariae]MCZ4282383.1 AzlC family ABC transporter permease [Kiloniella laminariae]
MKSSPPRDFGSVRLAYINGCKDAFGIPAIILGSTYMGFGALVSETGLEIWHALLSSGINWAIPGQIATMELYAVDASLFAIAAAVALINCRLLPMTIVLMPHIRNKTTPKIAYYFMSNFIAVTGWAAAMRQCPLLPEEQRFPYFIGFVIPLWSICMLSTAVGYYLPGILPGEITMGLVFLNPVYFMLVFVADFTQPGRPTALILGAILGPLTFLLSPDWNLLITGLIGGTIAFYIAERQTRRKIRKVKTE